MTILVTGATGCIGAALARRLAADGVPVRTLVRSATSSSQLEAQGVERADGDIRDAAAVRDAVRGCACVVHLAAQRTQRGMPNAVYHDVNVRGTESVTAAALAEGVPRLVFASTLGIHGFVTDTAIDETTRVRPNTPYRLTKLVAEEAVGQARRAGLSAIIIRISSTVGVGATQWLPYLRLMNAGRMRLIGGGRNAVDVIALDDVVHGIRRAIGAPDAPSGTYALGGGLELTARDFADKVARSLDRPPPGAGPPAFPYHLAARASDLAFKATGRAFRFAHGREWCVANKRVTIDLARVELGYAPRGDIDGALTAMVASFRADGRLASSRSDA